MEIQQAEHFFLPRPIIFDQWQNVRKVFAKAFTDEPKKINMNKTRKINTYLESRHFTEQFQMRIVDGTIVL